MIENPQIPLVGAGSGAYINGKYYWTIEDEDPDYPEHYRILSFDFDLEMFGVVGFPQDATPSLEATTYSLKTCHDSLALSAFCVDQSNEVVTYPLLISVQNSENTWNLKFRILLNHLGWPLKITRNGLLVVESYVIMEDVGHTTMLSYGLNHHQCRELGYGKPAFPDCEPESLFSIILHALCLKL